MSNTIKIVIVIAVALAVGFVAGVIGKQETNNLGGVTYDVSKLVGDVYQGMTDVLMMQSGVFVGPINTSQSTVLAGTVQVSHATASSTLRIGGTGGCIALALPGTTTLMYYTATTTANAILGSTTKPASCR